MTPEAGFYLRKANACIANAVRILELPIPDVAAREAYLAAYHAAEAFIFERTGKSVKTHRGARAEFSRLSREEPELRSSTIFLARGYELKSAADYGVEPDAGISSHDAGEAIEAARRLVAGVEKALGADQEPRADAADH